MLLCISACLLSNEKFLKLLYMRKCPSRMCVQVGCASKCLFSWKCLNIFFSKIWLGTIPVEFAVFENNAVSTKLIVLSHMYHMHWLMWKCKTTNIFQCKYIYEWPNLASLHCVFAYVPQNLISMKIQMHTLQHWDYLRSHECPIAPV